MLVGADWRIAGMRLHLGRNPISVKIIIGTICGNAPTTTQSRSFERYVGLGVRVLAGGWTRRNIFSFDVAEFRFWLNVVVGFIDENGRRRHAGKPQGDANRAVSLCSQFRPR